MLVGYFGLPLVKQLGDGNQTSGFFRIAVIIALVFCVCSAITFAFVRERERPLAVRRERTSVKEMIRVLIKNDQVIVVLILSLFEFRAPGICHNTAAILDADGRYLGKYRKMHIPQDPGFEEKFYFTPGDLGFRSWQTRFGRIGVIICWDQWYPESARLTALDGAEIIFCPTAIGGIDSEPESLAALQRSAWINAQISHSVANGCYYAAVNRVGVEGGTKFWGSSFVCDFYGNRIAEGSQDREEIVYAQCDPAAMEEHRRMWPFFRDRRIDAYQGILRRFRDEL